MVSMDKCSITSNAVDDLSMNKCVPSEKKHVDVKYLHLIWWLEEISGWNNGKCQCACKTFRTCKKDYIWNPSISICGNSRYLKRVINDSVVVCDKIISVADSISANMNILFQ